MKKLLLAITAATVLLGTNAHAVVVTVDRVAGYYSGHGGEFTISPAVNTGVGYAASVLVANRFGVIGHQSFCLEANSGLSIPGIYNAAINSAAISGGVSGGNPDPLSLGSAWLYYQFAKGTLSGYNYTPGVGREGSAAELQAALWQLEGEITGQNTGNNQFLALASSTLALDLTGLAADNNGTYRVGVLNLWSLRGEERQDQLTLVPDGGSALILLGLGMSGLAMVSRKLRA